MSSQGFSFPPPPPPPPRQQQQTHPAGSQYGQSYDRRGGRGGSQRGRGRGYGNRGGRGGHFTSDTTRQQYPTNTPPANYPAVNYGYTAQHLPTHIPGSIPTSQYTQSQPPGFPHAQSPSVYTRQSFSQPTPHMPPSPYQTQPGYNAAYHPSANTPHQSNPYPAHTASSYSAAMPHQSMMGHPMQWGFQYGGNAASYPGNQYGNVQNPWQYNSYGNQAYTGGTGSKHAAKRDHASAFSKPRATGPRTPAPPAVPSFGNPLPSKPPPSVDTARKPNKKKRKHNQLGLTPKTEEHESSEEEDDVDEESKLAGGDGDGDSGLKFTYRGRTSTLQSPADIAAWIAERKKKFPTQARVEEKKKAMEEAKKAREEAAKQRELQREESKRLQKEAWERKEREKHGGEDSPAKSPNPADAAAKAKLKADRLRRKLMKEERRIAKAEADAERARLKVEALQKGSTKDESGQDVGQDGHLQPANEQEAVVYQGDRESDTKPTDPDAQFTQTEPQIDGGIPGASLSASEDSDWTSSSGSDHSSTDPAESDSDDSAPEEMTSHRTGPDRVPPPPGEQKKRICRHFARNGRCLRGERCKFVHEMPERGPKTKPAENRGRRGILQALLDRQKEDEDRRVMEAIMVLGEKGALEEPGDGIE